ncbi:MAG: hypothetical protein MZW92_18665 [Comamonadaceae bacterium]|nr:hypothetical protein [Comamonadaceae bacterium]
MRAIIWREEGRGLRRGGRQHSRRAEAAVRLRADRRAGHHRTRCSRCRCATFTRRRRASARCRTDEIRTFLKAAFESNIRRQFKIGLHLILLTMVRKSELLLARWEHVDLEQAEWHIPAEHSKTRQAAHRVPARARRSRCSRNCTRWPAAASW